MRSVRDEPKGHGSMLQPLNSPSEPGFSFLSVRSAVRPSQGHFVSVGISPLRFVGWSLIRTSRAVLVSSAHLRSNISLGGLSSNKRQADSAEGFDSEC